MEGGQFLRKEIKFKFPRFLYYMSFSDPNFLLLFALIHNGGYRENVVMVTEQMQESSFAQLHLFPMYCSV